MNLQQEILHLQTKSQCTHIIDWVGDSQKRMDQLVVLFLGTEYRITQHAAWPLSYIAIAHPPLIQKHLAPLILNLEKSNLSTAVKRNTLRLLQAMDIPKKLHGRLMHTCFRFLEDPIETVAVKVFSITILTRLAAAYPQIIPELEVMVKDQLPRQTAAFRSRGAKCLLQLKKISMPHG